MDNVIRYQDDINFPPVVLSLWKIGTQVRKKMVFRDEEVRTILGTRNLNGSPLCQYKKVVGLEKTVRFHLNRCSSVSNLSNSQTREVFVMR